MSCRNLEKICVKDSLYLHGASPRLIPTIAEEELVYKSAIRWAEYRIYDGWVRTLCFIETIYEPFQPPTGNNQRSPWNKNYRITVYTTLDNYIRSCGTMCGSWASTCRVKCGTGVVGCGDPGERDMH
jgi:hypothetical protein